MIKIGTFIYPWGFGHYSRMMKLTSFLPNFLKNDFEIHYSSKGEIYQRLKEKFPTEPKCIHKILMPTPIEGEVGPSVTLSMINLLVPISNNPPLVKQISEYLKAEGELYDKEKFDLVINDGDVGSNVIAEKRKVTSLFVTNQFRPKLWKTRFYFYPSVLFVAKQMAKASKILVADSPPPYTICEYNLNFPENVKKKVTYVGHYANKNNSTTRLTTDLEKLIDGIEFGYWMRTGNKSTNEITGKKYEQVFHENKMKEERRIISHARPDPSLERVLGKDGKKYSISDALDKKIDWIQIDVGFLTESEKLTVLRFCKYAVINGSHTTMGEILGGNNKPIIGIPVYDEHTNQIKWAEERNLGVLAKNSKEVVRAVSKIKNNYNKFQDGLEEFSKNFVGNGAENTAKIVCEFIDNKK